jgi:hypothetical protein
MKQKVKATKVTMKKSSSKSPVKAKKEAIGNKKSLKRLKKA